MTILNIKILILEILLIYSPIDCFLFSVIIAIYNTGRYLDDSIGSLINQTIGFKNIQVILVNDGSIDNTEEICLKYQQKYNSNIIYRKINHGGVSIARNEGMKFATGKYINFLDADDIWDFKAFRLIYFFFKLYKRIDIVAGRLKFFEAIESYHPLDYKFYKTRIANLSKEYNCTHLSGPSSFFRNSLISQQRFKEDIFSGEDTIFINNILLINPLIGFIREAIYYYRRRFDSSSAVQTQIKKVDFYFSQVSLVGQYLIDKSKKLYNKVLPFIQFYIGYNVLFRILSPAFIYLNNSDYIRYCKIIIELLKEIEDNYILEQRFTSLKVKILALSKKYGRDIRYEINFQNECFIYSSYILLNLKYQNNLVVWNFLDINDKIIHLEGRDNFWMPDNEYFYFCKVGDKIFFPEYFKNSKYEIYTMFGLLDKGKSIIFNIPIENLKEMSIQIYLNFMGKNTEIIPDLGYYEEMPDIENGYYAKNNFIIKLVEKRIKIYNYDEELEKNFEKQYNIYLHDLQKDDIIDYRNKTIRYQNVKENIFKKETWIINDCQNRAGDNGEYFFRYLMNKNNLNIDVYFTINKSSSDFNRLKKYGNILDYGSKEYLYIFLNSNKIISSVYESWVTNPFRDDYNYIRDLVHFDFIYLQNGMISDGLIPSALIKNFGLFITSSKKEFNCIISSSYRFNKIKNVVLTGFPRFDHLEELTKSIKKERLILLIPAWRKFIRGTIDLVTHQAIYSDNFKNSTFFNFYNDFINDQRLITIFKKFNFTGIFCLHPSYSRQYSDFTQNNYFLVKENCNYQEYLAKSSLLITDYSNLFLDFAYIKRPIIYIQFDIKEYKTYNPNRYFNYEKDGFGPICTNINCVINEIIKEIENDCKIMNRYMRNINKYFAFSDKKNNDRIYLELTKKLNHYYSKSTKMIIYFFITFSSMFIKLKKNYINNLIKSIFF